MRRTAVLLAALSAGPACAQTVAPAAGQTTQQREGSAPAQQPEPLDSVTQKPLFGNLKWRKQLEADGVKLNAHFYVEPAYVDKGVKGHGTTSVQQLDFGGQFDLRKLKVADQGSVRVQFSWRTGVAAHVEYTGGYIQNQAFWGQGQNFRLDEVSYERTILDPRLDLKAGFYSMGNDFGGLSYTCNFTNNGHCGHPLSLPTNSGWLDSPTGGWGGRLKWTSTNGVYLAGGVYDVTPARKRSGRGFDLGFHETTGAVAPIEFGWVRGKTPADYPGTYKVGFYYDTSRVKDIAGARSPSGDPVTRGGREGGYVQAAQQIIKMHKGRIEGISIFGVATVGDRQTSTLPVYYEAGASWRGVIPGRNNDILSFGWIEADVNPRLYREELRAHKPRQTDEQFYELNYGWQAFHWLLIRPGVQYVVRPGGYATRPDTVVAVGHILATF